MFVTEYHWEFSMPRGLMEVCLLKVKFTEEFKKIELFFDTFLVYEIAYPRVQLGLECVAF